MVNKQSIYYLNGRLYLPRSIRTYFDSGAHEWGELTKEEKLLDLGYVITKGYDVAADIKELLDSHSYIREYDIKHSLAVLMAELTGKDWAIIDYFYDEYSWDEMFEDFEELLFERYVLLDDESEHYIISI